MAKKSKIILILFIIVIIFVVLFASYRRIYKEHEAKLIKVTTNKVVEAGKKCYLDNKCKGNSVTIKELKELGYLEKDIINPLTKELLNEDLVVTYKNKECSFKLR